MHYFLEIPVATVLVMEAAAFVCLLFVLDLAGGLLQELRWRRAAALALLLLASPAHAATVSGDSVLQAFLVQDVIPLAGMLLSTLAVALIGMGVRYAARRWHLNLTQQQVQYLDDLAGKAIAYAEEAVAAYVKAHPDFKAPAKLDLALGFMQEQAKATNLPAVLEAKFADYVHAKLGATAGVGASSTPATPPAAPATPAPAAVVGG